MLVKSLQNDMEEDIEALGKLLADEVKKHLLISYHKYKRINFVGYSLGGIVARESLKHLEEFKDKMNVFISFASPHLGITDNSNMLVRLGIWFLTNFDKAKNLKQLTCKPNENDRVTLVSLATCECLSWFSRFVAVSSKDDDFVPYYSSRLDEQVANG